MQVGGIAFGDTFKGGRGQMQRDLRNTGMQLPDRWPACHMLGLGEGIWQVMRG